MRRLSVCMLLTIACLDTPSGTATLTAAELRGHVETLASDAFQGRDTLGEGGDKAAAYIREHFAKIGLQPLPGFGDFAVPYTLYTQGVDPVRTGVTIGVGGERFQLTAGRDVRPFPFSDAGEVTADVVFAGYGITAPDLQWDDYADLDVEGKVVLVLRHEPHENDPDSTFGGEESTDHALFTTKARNAFRHGAVGMILVTDPVAHKESDDLRLSRGLSITPPDADDASIGGEQQDTGTPGTFLALHISRSAGERIVAGTGKTLLQVQEAVDAGVAPAAISLGQVEAELGVTRNDAAETVVDHNVIGFIEGRDPDSWVVVGAHYDHLGAFAGEGDTIYNGADDNASGTAGVLELAEAFASSDTKPERSIVFALFSGEEKGLLGSRATVRDGVLPADKVAFMLNLDMIGRNDGEVVEIMGDGYSTGVGDLVTALNADLALDLELGGVSYTGASDHDSFYREDVPFMFFFTGLHDDYHQLSDHADKLDYGRMEKIVQLGYGVLDEVASGRLTPAFVHHVSWLGVAAQAVDGAATVTAVEAGSRGEEAGLAVGDQLTSFGGVGLDTPEAMGEAFRAIEPGAVVQLGILRDAAPSTVEVIRARTGYLGVWPAQVDDDVRTAFGLHENEGLSLARVLPDGPAAAAGLEDGDVLYRIGGYPVGLADLGKHLARIGAGESVDVMVVRAGERVKLELVLGERPDGR